MEPNRNPLHNYSSEGTYEIEIFGTIKGFTFKNGGDAAKLTSINESGPLKLGNGGGYFNGAANLLEVSLSNMSFSETTNFSQMFRNAFTYNLQDNIVGDITFKEGKNTIPDQNIVNWDVSHVTDMSLMFYESGFDQSLNNWNVSNVIDMSGMFASSGFNQPIADWDVSKVTDMSGMFYPHSFQPTLGKLEC